MRRMEIFRSVNFDEYLGMIGLELILTMNLPSVRYTAQKETEKKKESLTFRIHDPRCSCSKPNQVPADYLKVLVIIVFELGQHSVFHAQQCDWHYASEAGRMGRDELHESAEAQRSKIKGRLIPLQLRVRVPVEHCRHIDPVVARL